MIKRVLIFLIISIFLSGCSSRINQEEISFASWGSVSEVEILKNVISGFERENPDIKVKFIHIPQNYFQKIHLLFASNTALDVLFINNLYIPVYESKLEDLSLFVNPKKYYSQAIRGMSYNGRILAVPRDISNQVYYINTDIIKIPKREISLEELLKIAQEIDIPNVFGFGYEDDIYWALPYLKYFGGGILDKEGNLIIDSLESRRGIEFYKALKDIYGIAPSKSQVGSATLAQMFLDKRIAIYLSGRWMYPKISEKADFNWKVIPFPKGKSPQPCDVSGWAISKNSKHKTSAFRFLEYISNSKNIGYFAQTGLIVPAETEAAKMLNNNIHNEKAFLEAIRYSESRNVNKQYKKLIDKINMESNF